MSSRFVDALSSGLGQMNIVLDDLKLNKCHDFHDLVVEWNEKFNLTSLTDDVESAEKHFIDSLLLAKVDEWNQDLTICDVGSGAGFPGVPMKISFDLVNVTLLDSLKKRVGFLEHAINQLQLENAKAIHSRVEDFAREEAYRDKFDRVVSRAVARLNVLSELCLPLVKPGGKFYAMKGPDADVEIEEAGKALGILGAKVVKVHSFELPFSGDQRNIIEIKKVKATPTNYPRKPGIPAKKPL